MLSQMTYVMSEISGPPSQLYDIRWVDHRFQRIFLSHFLNCIEGNQSQRISDVCHNLQFKHLKWIEKIRIENQMQFVEVHYFRITNENAFLRNKMTKFISKGSSCAFVTSTFLGNIAMFWNAKELLSIGPCVPSLLFCYNCLIAIIFAYFNRENNRYNHFVKP